MMKKKNNLVTIIIIVVVAVVIVGLGYFLYDKSLKKQPTNNNTVNDVNQNTTDEKVESLDINNNVVKELYNKVTLAEDSYYKYWFYGRDDNYLVSSAPESSKMALVFHNLVETDFTAIPNASSIAQTVDLNGSIYTLNTANNKDFVPYDNVLRTYQSLFGTSASLSKDVPLQVSAHTIDYYVYNAELNGYVNYIMEGGGTSPSFYHGEITKAVKKDNSIIITEKVEYSENMDGKKKVSSTSYYEYTFKSESDGTYSFVSRIKSN